VHGLELWRDRWRSAGVQVIPLKAHSKEPVFNTALRGWSKVPPDEQWRECGGPDFRGNIAAVLGQGIGVLDADNEQAVISIAAFFDGIGMADIPTVRTVSDGRHYWIRVLDAPESVSFRHLASDVGDGELRVSRCYVAVPCSAIGDKRYKFISGSPESITRQRAIKWQDLRALITSDAYEIFEFERPPVRCLRRALPAKAERLLTLLFVAPQSVQVTKDYKSRSEAEAAVVAMAILSGWTFEEIVNLFEHQQPGKYESERAWRKKYLAHTYKRVLSDICSVPERLQLAELYHEADEMLWPGRTGLLNKAVYKAILAIAWQWQTFTVSASIRDIAEHATGSKQGVNNAIKRLCELGLIRKLSPGTSHKAALYQVNFSRKVDISHVYGYKAERLTCQSTPARDPESDADMLTWQECELWSQTALGRSAGLVYACLSVDVGVRVSVLAERTDRAWGTVKLALEKLERYKLAEREGKLWRRGPADVLEVAAEFEAKQRAKSRRYAHEHERQVWEETIKRLTHG